MNCYQKTWLPALPLEESNKLSHTSLASGFQYNGCFLAPSASTGKPRRPKRTAPLSRPQSVGGVSGLAGSSLGSASAATIDSRPAWYSSLSPFDRSIPQMSKEMAAPSAEGRRVLRSIASADDMRRRVRKEKEFTAPHRRAARYGASVRQHVAGAGLLDAIERREKYLAWTRALLQQDDATRPSTEQAQRQLLTRLREDVLTVLSSLSVATLQVLEAVAHWRGVMGNARLVPVWNEADYLRKLQRDTHFLLRHRLLDALAISGHTGAVLPFVDALASSHGVARLAEGSALQQPAVAPAAVLTGAAPTPIEAAGPRAVDGVSEAKAYAAKKKALIERAAVVKAERKATASDRAARGVGRIVPLDQPPSASGRREAAADPSTGGPPGQGSERGAPGTQRPQTAKQAPAVTAVKPKQIPAQLRWLLGEHWERVAELFADPSELFGELGVAGRVSKRELLAGLQHLGLQAEIAEVTQLYRSLDEAGRGTIDLAELRALLHPDSPDAALQAPAPAPAAPAASEQAAVLRPKWLPARGAALKEAEQACAEWVWGAEWLRDGAEGSPATPWWVEKLKGEKLELAVEMDERLRPRVLLGRLRAAEAMLAREETLEGVPLVLAGAADATEQPGAYEKELRRQQGLLLWVRVPRPLAPELSYGHAAAMVQLLMRGAATLIQAYARLHAALGRTPAAGQLSGHARRRVFALWLKTGRGMGGQQAAAIWRTVTISEALTALKARWTRQELEAGGNAGEGQDTSEARAVEYARAVKRQALRRCREHIEEHVERAQVARAAEGQRLTQSEVVVLVAEFAAGLFDE